MSIELTNTMIFWGAALALLCVVASGLSRRVGAPVLLVFLVLGMLAGKEGVGGIRFDDIEQAFMFGSIALALIIFDGGQGARKDTFRVSLGPALSLATVGVVITAALTGLAVRLILGLPWLEALLIGAIVGSTDAAAVFGLLRAAGLELKERTGATLEIESGSNDPMAIFLTITLVELLVLRSDYPGWEVLAAFIQQMGMGIVLGAAGGYLLVLLLKRLPLPLSMYPLLALAGGMSVFGLTNLWGGSGFLAIYVVGIMVGNASLPHAKDIRRLHDGVAWLAQIGMFLMLGLLITPSSLVPVFLPAMGIALALILVARPMAVLLSLLPFHFPWREQLFISWCGLRGAVPIILALFPSLAGLEMSATYFELAFFVVLVSLVLQGWTIAPVARWLRVEVPHSLEEPEHLVLKIPDDQEKELLVYQAVTGSPAINLPVRRLPLSGGAQLMGVVRHGILLEDWQEQKLLADDYVVVLAADGGIPALARLFAPTEVRSYLQSSAFFGNFVIKPDAKLADLSQMYGFEVPEALQAMTVAAIFDKRFHHKPVVGDRVRLGVVQLVVKKLDGDRIAAVGLKLG
ncbi:potassium/proton antiporter [Kineobactrum sediminis]|uniref:Potassium/proton antiporter n=2 Tax=Kineobactrum sediminis TaxID=1905677 RepID=A0A2N5XXW5_9GAMM|nr:potassium/proton antiporter [Kineobactrum sediminis]